MKLVMSFKYLKYISTSVVICSKIIHLRTFSQYYFYAYRGIDPHGIGIFYTAQP